MLIYKDILSGDEMISDAKPMKLVDDVVYEVRGKAITVSNSVQLDGANPSAEGEDEDGGAADASESGIDIIISYRLQETSYDKKSFLGYLKNYMKKLKEKIPEDRHAEFEKKVSAFVKDKLLKKFDDLQFYTGESMDPEGGMAYSFYPEGETEPTFWFFKDGLKEIKC